MNMDSYKGNCIEIQESDFKELSSLLKVVGEFSRLKLLGILYSRGCHCVCDLENHVKDMSQSLISHHLADLKQAGLVSYSKEGLRANYELTEKGCKVCNIVFLLLNKEECMEKNEKMVCCCCGKECECVPNKNNKCCESCMSDKKLCLENCKNNCQCCKNGGCASKDKVACEECC